MKKHYFIYAAILYIPAIAGNQRYTNPQKSANHIQTDSVAAITKQPVNNTRIVSVVVESNSEK